MIKRLAGGFFALSALLGLIFYFAAGPKEKRIESAEVWAHIVEVTEGRSIDPEFLYAIAWAESSLDAHAKTSVARGMMQMTEAAWSDMTNLPYQYAWDWRVNIRVSLDYLEWCRAFLETNKTFTYPLLAACYRYGPQYVKDRNFDIRKVDRPKNEIYRKIFDGDLRPVAPPVLQIP